jgi:type I restriction enzyme, S subunit
MEPGDILFSHINSVEHIGKCAVYRGTPEKLVHGMNLLCLRCDTAKLLPEFAKYLIRGPEFRTRLSNFINKAVNQASVSIGNLKTIPVSVPPLAEQRRIAEVLDRAEALRAKRRAAITQLDTLTQSIFLDLFGDPATNPKTWPDSTIGNMAEQVTDGEHLTPKRTTEGIKLLSARNIRDGHIDFKNVDYIGPEEYDRIRGRCNPSLGDVLISCSGTIGRVASVNTDEPFALVRSVALVRPKREAVTTEFLENYLRTPALKARMLRRANASSQANLFQGQIRELPIFVPPVTLQRDFARRVAAVEKLKTAHGASLTNLDVLFAAIQHRAFQGEL